MGISTNELFSIVDSLPIDIKTRLLEKLLKSLNPTFNDIDGLWFKEVEDRSKEIESGKVNTISGDLVFKEIKEKYNL